MPRNRFPVLGTGHLAQLHWHRERGRCSLRLIWRQRLLLRLTFRLNCSLKRQARRLLAGNMLDRRSLWAPWLGARLSAPRQRKNDLSDLNFLSFLDLHLFYRAANRRRNFHYRFLSFELHHRLAFRNFHAGTDHEPDQISLINVLAQFRQLEFQGSNSWRGTLR